KQDLELPLARGAILRIGAVAPGTCAGSSKACARRSLLL
ncbi:hypothetical protein A2U01_0061084, partial [Trifolium medium]|nr:hypothetical protein [Trifolium medium]